MAKAKFLCQRLNYGIYDHWNRDSRELPKIREFTTTIPARLDIEFGFILNIKKAKGKLLSFCIDHPPFTGKNGETAPPFTGEEYIRSNDWNFYLGDTLWAPIEDKLGPWRMTVEIEDQLVADETFLVAAIGGLHHG